MENRVVVTGMGALTPAGLTVQNYWQALLKGQDGIGPVTYFDASDFTSQIVGELKGFEPSAHFTPKEARRFDPFVQYALAAASEAIADSGLALDALDKSRAGVIVSSGIGGIALGHGRNVIRGLDLYLYHTGRNLTCLVVNALYLRVSLHQQGLTDRLTNRHQSHRSSGHQHQDSRR